MTQSSDTLKAGRPEFVMLTDEAARQAPSYKNRIGEIVSRDDASKIAWVKWEHLSSPTEWHQDYLRSVPAPASQIQDPQCDPSVEALARAELQARRYLGVTRKSIWDDVPEKVRAQYRKWAEDRVRFLEKSGFSIVKRATPPGGDDGR